MYVAVSFGKGAHRNFPGYPPQCDDIYWAQINIVLPAYYIVIFHNCLLPSHNVKINIVIIHAVAFAIPWH